MNRNHPCLVTLDARSAPRVLFAGDRLVEVPLPPGARVLYPRTPRTVRRNLVAAVQEALRNPIGSRALRDQLRPGMKVTIAVEDRLLPGAGRYPDPRRTVVEQLLQVLDEAHVAQVQIVVACGLRRRLTNREIARLLGPKVFERFAPRRLHNHDAEDSASMTRLGVHLQVPVELNRHAVDSQLLVHVCIGAEAGASSATLLDGLSAYSSVRASREASRAGGHDLFTPVEPPTVAAIESYIHQQLNVFRIEATLATDPFAESFSFLAKNEDELTRTEQLMLRSLMASMDRLPPLGRQLLLQRIFAMPKVTSVLAGAPAEVTQRARQDRAKNASVFLAAPADVLVTSISPTAVDTVGSAINPLLVAAAAQGTLFDQSTREPLVRRGGTLIFTHPCTDAFDHRRHVGHLGFVHQLLATSKDVDVLEQRFDHDHARDPALIDMYRFGYAYHPAHALALWQRVEVARRYLGRVIVVGADNEYVPRLLDYETAPNMAEALHRGGVGKDPSATVLCLHWPPTSLADVPAAGGVG